MGEYTCKNKIIMTKEEALKKLKELHKDNGEYRDFECDHLDADQILCDFLSSMGHQDIVDAFADIGKWYS